MTCHQHPDDPVRYQLIHRAARRGRQAYTTYEPRCLECERIAGLRCYWSKGLALYWTSPVRRHYLIGLNRRVRGKYQYWRLRRRAWEGTAA